MSFVDFVQDREHHDSLDAHVPTDVDVCQWDWVCRSRARKEAISELADAVETTLIPGGQFAMGAGGIYPEEQPMRHTAIGDVLFDIHPVTNKEFARFIEATSYVTVAESHVDDAGPGSLVFQLTAGPVDLRNWRQWWAWVPDACWYAPLGPGSSIAGLMDHPVVHIAYADAVAYASWAGKRLPTEAEFEYAACGGSVPAPYAWGTERDPDGRFMANTWRGAFPYLNTAADGWERTSPVGVFPANGYGLYDMIGNVWEWTSSRYAPSHAAPTATCPCLPATTSATGSTYVLKGGSHLCAPEYCLRYRPAARSPQDEDSSSSHIGFRCVTDVG